MWERGVYLIPIKYSTINHTKGINLMINQNIIRAFVLCMLIIPSIGASDESSAAVNETIKLACSTLIMPALLITLKTINPSDADGISAIALTALPSLYSWSIDKTLTIFQRIAYPIVSIIPAITTQYYFNNQKNKTEYLLPMAGFYVAALLLRPLSESLTQTVN